MTENNLHLPADLHHMDDDEKALAGMTNRADRMKYHRKRLQFIGFHQGAEGLAAYKAKFPEAVSIRVKLTSIAGESKPQGYDDFLCKLVDHWFISDMYLNESNRATVERLNVAMAPARFDPDRHFSRPLSAGRLKKLAEIFAKHGAHLGASKPMNLIQVRDTAKVAKAQQTVGKPFANVGRIAGNQLVVGNQSFTVMQHHGHDCIKITLGGKRQWLRLDVAAEFITLAGLEVTPLLSSIEDIRELVPDDENAASDARRAGGEDQPSGELVPTYAAPRASNAELVPAASPTLSEQAAARRSARLYAAVLGDNPTGEQAHAPAAHYDPDAEPDPLARS